jgi:hypothetical protein
VYQISIAWAVGVEDLEAAAGTRLVPPVALGEERAVGEGRGVARPGEEQGGEKELQA